MIRKMLARVMKSRTQVLLLALLIGCTSTLAGAHVHAFEKTGLPNSMELAEDCALCHASHASTLESYTPSPQKITAAVSVDWGAASAIRLGYTYKPESRAPPPYS